MTNQVDVIGGVVVRVDGVEAAVRRQVRRLLAILVAAGPTGITDTAIADELWIGRPPERWDPAVRNGIASLRKLLGSEAITTASGRYTLQLDPDQVDAWRVLEAATNGAASPDVLPTSTRFHPFDGLELTPILREMADALAIARVQLLAGLKASGELDPVVVAGLIAAVRADPFDEPASVGAMTSLIDVGRFADALTLLKDVEQAFITELNVGLPPALEQLRIDAQSGLDRAQGQRARSGRGHVLPSVVDDLTRRPMTTRHQTLANELAKSIIERSLSPRLILSAPEGSGKTRFAAEIGLRLHELGAAVIFASGHAAEANAYGPFLAAMPDFRQRFPTVDSDNEAMVWTLWSATLEQHAEPRSSLVLLVDDCHLLESASVRLVQFAHRMQPTLPLSTVLIGGSTVANDRWSELRGELVNDDRTQAVDVPPLGIDDVEELIERRWPDAPTTVRRDAAIEVADASGGMPLMANLLIDSLNGVTLQRPRRDRSPHSDLIADRLRQLDDELQPALAAAAVANKQLTTEVVGRLLDAEPEAVEARLDDLAQRGILSNIDDSMTYRFNNELTRNAALELATRTTRSRWHRIMVEMVDDPVRRAEHAIASNQALDTSGRVRLLLDGADVAFARGLTRRGVQLALASIEQDHDAQSRLQHTRALARLAVSQAKLGALEESAATRSVLLNDLETEEQVGIAAKALLDSIPFVENDRSASMPASDLERLPAHLVPHDLRLPVALALSRLAAYQGRTEFGSEVLAQAATLASSPDEQADVFIGARFTDPDFVDAAWFDDAAILRGRGISPSRVAKISQLEALEHAALANWDETETSIERTLEFTSGGADSMLHWFGLVLSGSVAYARGRLEAATRLADRALDHGMLYAIPHAFATRVAFDFNVALHTDTVGAWLRAIDSGPPEIGRTTFATAGIARARFESGERSRAWNEVRDLVDESLATRNRQALSLVAILAPLIRELAPAPTVRRAIDVAERAGDHWVITGVGIGVHGPARRIAATISGDRAALLQLRSTLANEPWRSAIDHDLSALG